MLSQIFGLCILHILLLKRYISWLGEDITDIYDIISEELYTSEKTGSDERGDGSEAKPFKTILRVRLRVYTSSEEQHAGSIDINAW